MRELLAKKHAKIQKKQSVELVSKRDEKPSSDFECQKISKHQVGTNVNIIYVIICEIIKSSAELTRKTCNGHLQVIKHDRHRPRKSLSTNSATARSRGWHPSLNSISESSS